jgi:D-methionine transport system substrate-binding protein
MKKFLSLILSVLLIGLLAGCGSNGATSSVKGSEDQKTIKFGATSGPYSDMVTKAIKPILEKKGYKVDVVEFSDYVQPNMALANDSLDANLFQHVVYMKKFAKDKGLELSNVIIVPTAPLGLYSNKYKAISEIKDGSTVAVANDPTNLARALLLLQSAGLIKIDPNIDPLKASEKDVKENPKHLKFTPIEAAQLPRSLESTDVSAVPGNFALAAKMDLLSAIELEDIPEQYMNQVVVKTSDLESQVTKDIKQAVESPEFEKVIDEQFKGFVKPKWMEKK